MENALQERKQKILRRLENAIECSNCILYEINQELESIVESNRSLERAAEMYDTWCRKA